MYVGVNALVQYTVDGVWNFALCVVEREVPSLTAFSTARNAKVTHVHHAEVCVSFFLYKLAFLGKNKKKVLGNSVALTHSQSKMHSKFLVLLCC